jgi:hypothetical protein
VALEVLSLAPCASPSRRSPAPPQALKAGIAQLQAEVGDADVQQLQARHAELAQQAQQLAALRAQNAELAEAVEQVAMLKSSTTRLEALHAEVRRLLGCGWPCRVWCCLQAVMLGARVAVVATLLPPP